MLSFEKSDRTLSSKDFKEISRKPADSEKDVSRNSFAVEQSEKSIKRQEKIHISAPYQSNSKVYESQIALSKKYETQKESHTKPADSEQDISRNSNALGRSENPIEGQEKVYISAPYQSNSKFYES